MDTVQKFQVCIRCINSSRRDDVKLLKDYTTFVLQISGYYLLGNLMYFLCNSYLCIDNSYVKFASLKEEESNIINRRKQIIVLQ